MVSSLVDRHRGERSFRSSRLRTIVDLPEGAGLELAAEGSRAERLLEKLSGAMRLADRGSGGAGGQGSRSLLVSYEDRCLNLAGAFPSGRSVLSATMRFPLKPCPDLLLCSDDPEDRVVRDLVVLSLVVGAQAQSVGGVLLHGALAERAGVGVLLLGPSGRGKTTASRRLPPPWLSLSDDMSLVLPPGCAGWSAHPWPTWSSFRGGAGGGGWDVQRGVDLGGLFFLVQGAEDSVEPIGPGRAACFLMESFGQAWSNGEYFFPAGFLKSVRETAYGNICSLAGSTPAFLLEISREGSFWEKIDAALGEARRGR